MQSFKTAKFILGLIIIGGWIVVALSVFVFFIPGLELALWTKVVGLIGASLYGLVLVAIGQMGLAQIATAENTKRMVDLLGAGRAITNSSGTVMPARVGKIEPSLTKPK